MSVRLAEALRRQRGLLKRLLTEAGVKPADAEWLLLDVLDERSGEEWKGVRDIDKVLVAGVDRACAGYASRRGRAYQGLRALERSPWGGGAGRQGGAGKKRRRS